MLDSRFMCVCFFKQKTAYEMRISDLSSDVCSSDLGGVSGIFVAVYNSGARGATPEKYDDALKIIDLVKSQVTLHPNDLVLATSADDIVAAKQAADRHSVV